MSNGDDTEDQIVFGGGFFGEALNQTNLTRKGERCHPSSHRRG